MFNILLVDDEIQAIHNVKEGIDWHELGIQEVFTAYSMKQAIEIYGTKDVDIMLCDIEMPKGNGIELLKWVRENKAYVENIFLTCHADFSFAKEAISLGSMDYLLKPVPFATLSATIRKAVDKCEEKQRIDREIRQGAYWEEGKKRLVEQFFLELLLDRIKKDNRVIRAEAMARNIDTELGEGYIMILLAIQKYGKYVANWEKDVRLFSFRNIAEEIFGMEDQRLLVLFPGEDQILLLLEDQRLNSKQLEVQTQTYLDMTKHYLGSEVCAYIGQLEGISETSVRYMELSELAINHVVKHDKILYLQEKKQTKSTYTPPDRNLMKLLLKEGKSKELLGYIEDYFNHRKKHQNIDALFMDQYAADFLQVLMNVLEEKQIEVREVFDDQQIKGFYLESAKSIEVCQQLSAHMIGKLAEAIADKEQSISRIEKARRYILGNLDQEISRESVAAYVYLNPDYLNKLFKKELGMTLSDYIYMERMKLAEKLLLTTEASVRDIALQVGYGNFSHFSKMFARFAGKTPKAYKKSMSR